MRIVIITQARMGSTRLAQKVMKEVVGKSLLEHHLQRLQRSKYAHHLVVATTIEPADAVIAALCQRLGVDVFRGSHHDVLERYYYTSLYASADIIVRVTSDCPLIDPSLVDMAIEQYLYESKKCCDYLSLKGFPRGLDVEICSHEALARAHRHATDSVCREHVMPYFYLYNSKRCRSLQSREDLSFHRWTVDTPEDFLLIQHLLEELYSSKPTFSWRDVLQCFERYPHWLQVNGHIQQKALV